MINCFSFAPRNSIPALVSKICNYLSEHPGWSREELKEALEGLVISESTGKICYFSDGAIQIEELNILDLYNSSYRLVFTNPTVNGEYTKLYGLEYQSGNVVAYQLMSGISENDFNAITTMLGEKYSANNPPPYPVTSVNGKTGDVTGLYSNENEPPYPVTSVNGRNGNISGLYDSENPPPYPVTSVNGKTGAVVINEVPTDAYTPSNPPPYPVTSVNGKTGAVVIDEVPTNAYTPSNPPPYPVSSVNGLTGNVEISGVVKRSTIVCPKDYSYGGYYIPSGSNRPTNKSQILSVSLVSASSSGYPNNIYFEPATTSEGSGVSIRIWGIGIVIPGDGQPYNSLTEYTGAEEVTFLINYVEA